MGRISFKFVLSKTVVAAWFKVITREMTGFNHFANTPNQEKPGRSRGCPHNQADSWFNRQRKMTHLLSFFHQAGEASLSVAPPPTPILQVVLSYVWSVAPEGFRITAQLCLPQRDKPKHQPINDRHGYYRVITYVARTKGKQTETFLSESSNEQVHILFCPPGEGEESTRGSKSQTQEHLQSLWSGRSVRRKTKQYLKILLWIWRWFKPTGVSRVQQ